MGWLNSGPESEGDDTSGDDMHSSDGSAAPRDGAAAARDDREAARLHKLHEVTSQIAKLERRYRDAVRDKDAQLRESRDRAEAVERRIRERDGQLSALREEKAGCARQIGDLKNQLYQLQFEVEETTCDKADAAHQFQSQLVDAQRELAEAKRAAEGARQAQADLAQENGQLKQRWQSLQDGRDGHQADARDLQQQLAALAATNATLGTQIAAEKADAGKSQQLNAQEIASLRSTLRARDEAIQSLQGRVEQGATEMTTLEAELDGLRGAEGTRQEAEDSHREEAGRWRGENEDLRRQVEEQRQALEEAGDGRRRDEEMHAIVEQQSQALEDMTDNWRRQQEECGEQRALATRRGEEVDRLTAAVQEGRAEREASAARGNSSRSRASALDMELQETNEKADELTAALNEAMEEIEDLQADVVFKEGRIASLEREIGEASGLLEARAAAEAPRDRGQAPSSPDRRDSGHFARLREEIENVTRERARLEGELRAETARASALGRSLTETGRAKAALAHELEKTREVMDQLDAEEDRELEETKHRVQELEMSNDNLQCEIEELRGNLAEKEREMTDKSLCAEEELREAQQALVALDKQGGRTAGRGERKSLNETLTAYKEQMLESEAKLARATREKDTVISDLRCELTSKEEYAEVLRGELESLQLSVERPAKRNYGMAIDPEWHEPDVVSKLELQVSKVTKEKRMVEHELRAKIDARDATIATLVLATSNQEASIGDLTSEVTRLQHELAETTSSSETVATEQLRDVKASQRREVERLQERTHDLTLELTQTKRRLSRVTEELECAKSQLDTAHGTPDVQELAGRLVIAEQAQKMLQTENADKLQERDAAIANLLQSVQANQGVVSNLRADVASLQREVGEGVEENRRLQHESEIFAAQIIDQDEEFDGLNDRLKEKTSEIASLKRGIASSSAEVRDVKNLERQLHELQEEKKHSNTTIRDLEDQLRDVKLNRAKEDGFEVERLQLELKRAIDDKETTEEKLTNQIESLRRLRNHAVEEFETKLQARADQITSLESELLELKEKVSEDDFDDIFLDEKQGQSKKQFLEENTQLLEERDMLLIKVRSLGEDIASLRAVADSQQLSELKNKLAHSERLREELEKDRSMLSASKDKDMDRVRRQLSEARETQTARETEQLGLLKKLESENHDIREEFTIQIQQRNAKIVALEQTLAAQEQVVGNMSNEMDQLQNGMEKVSVARRAEIEEISQELMDYKSSATKLEREVRALSMKLDDKKLKHKTELAKLKEKVAELESETPFERTVRRDVKHEDSRREQELADKNDHLKWLNGSLKGENDKLKGKVEQLKASHAKKDDKIPASKSAKNNDRWRNIALQEQVAVLSQRVIELEEVSASAAQMPQAPRPSILQSPVMRSSLERGVVSPTGRPPAAPKSALRVSTYDAANQANHDLLSNDEAPALAKSALVSPAPPALPKSSGVSKSSETSKRRFSLRHAKKGGRDRFSSSPKFDDASTSNSTANYDF